MKNLKKMLKFMCGAGKIGIGKLIVFYVPKPSSSVAFTITFVTPPHNFGVPVLLPPTHNLFGADQEGVNPPSYIYQH